MLGATVFGSSIKKIQQYGREGEVGVKVGGEGMVEGVKLASPEHLQHSGTAILMHTLFHAWDSI